MALLFARAALLQALSAGDGYGLQLQKRVADASGGLIRLNPGNLYPTLRAMVEAGEAVDAGDGCYSLTGKGRAAAQAQREALAGLLAATAPKTLRGRATQAVEAE